MRASASASLRSALRLCAAGHPRAFVQGIVSRVLAAPSEPSSGVIEALNGAIKAAFGTDAMAHMARALCGGAGRGAWGAGHLALVQTGLDAGMSMGPELAEGMVGALGEAAREQGGNVKFAKVVLTLVQKHGPLLVGRKEALRAIAGCTKNFLSKALCAKVEALG
ncbi:unnamed protein product [Ostreobium quekettii]|uniref:Uncharacterized protein n=1 Tax=Ostreobium quekettii TaxID=121088 RepID=A0A8S1J816_9CHLO|nr:unnamed protein product [Ostreobium quekettii]